MKELADSMIGKILVTKQTGAAGKICNSVMVTARMFPRKEYYVSVMLERTFDVSIYSSILFILYSGRIIRRIIFFLQFIDFQGSSLYYIMPLVIVVIDRNI